MVELIQVEATAPVLRALRAVEELELTPTSIKALGDGVYRVGGYVPVEGIARLTALGATVQVLMTAAQIDAFHAEVAAEVGQPPETAPPPAAAVPPADA